MIDVDDHGSEYLVQLKLMKQRLMMTKVALNQVIKLIMRYVCDNKYVIPFAILSLILQIILLLLWL